MKFKYFSVILANKTIYNLKDVPHNLFDKEYIERAENEDSPERDGLRIHSMLTKDANGQEKGKIYALYNWYDYALVASTTVGGNWLNRVGQAGIGSYDKMGYGWEFDEERVLHPDIYGHTESFNVNPKLQWNDKVAHGYHWYDFVIEYYKEKIEE